MTEPHTPKPRRTRKPRTATPAPQEGKPLQIMRRADQTDEEALAESALAPFARHAILACSVAGRAFGEDAPDPTASMNYVRRMCEQVRHEDLSGPTDTLVAQLVSMDALYTELTRAALRNMAEHPAAFEHYMRFALRVQSQTRATAEALGKLVRGGEQVVRHIHVDNRGGQAVITETVHAGGQNAGSAEQPHAAIGADNFASLRSPNALGSALPFAGDAERALPNAWGNVAGSTARQPECVEARGTVAGVSGTAADGERP